MPQASLIARSATDNDVAEANLQQNVAGGSDYSFCTATREGKFRGGGPFWIMERRGEWRVGAHR